MRRAAKVDATQAEVVRALRAEGCFVQSLASVGGGVPDLLVSTPYQNKHPKWVVIEVKSKGGVLTADQRRWIALCNAPVHVVYSAEDAVRVVREAA